MNSYGSHNVFASASNTLALLSGPVTVLVLLPGYWIYWRRSAAMTGTRLGRLPADPIRGDRHRHIHLWRQGILAAVPDLAAAADPT